MKDILLYSAIVIVGLGGLCLLIWLIAKKRHLLASSISGLLGLVGVNLLAQVTGVSLGYTVLSIGLSAILGLPGVALLLLLRLI